MHPHTYLSPYERACDCRCPAHDRRPRFDYTDPGCHCLITCASQPVTVHTDAALFLNYHGNLWTVPALQPGHWDWRHATQIDEDTDPAVAVIAHLLREAATELQHLPAT